MSSSIRATAKKAHFCKYCGTKVSSEAVYCPLCGKPSLLLQYLSEVMRELIAS